MSSLFTASEIALARLGQSAPPATVTLEAMARQLPTSAIMQ